MNRNLLIFRLFVVSLVAMNILFIPSKTAIGFVNSIDEGKIIAIKDAVSKWLCFDKYWCWGPYELGKILQITIKIDGDKFYVWIDDLYISDKVRMVGYYEGRTKDGQTAVVLREAFDSNFKSAYLYSTRNSIFIGGSVIKTNLSIPMDCTPHYDNTTKDKELMIATIVNTIKNRLNHPMHINGTDNDAKREIIIADFNVDYPWTSVFVESTNTVYDVTLHDLDDYFGHMFEKEGFYPVGINNEPTELLIDRIKKHGIIRKY